jgi:hypothetical protein
MGIFQYIDPQTGRSYNFEHAGEAPTNEDYAYIASYLDQEREEYAKKYQDVFGREFETPDDGTAIGRGYARGYQQVKGAFGETLGTLGEQTGLGFLERYGTGLEERARQEQGLLSLMQPERMQSTDVDSIGSALTYAGELVGEQIPQLGLGLGAAVAVPVLAGATGVAAPFLIGAGAAGVVTAPILFGNNIQRQEDEVAAGKRDRVDVSDALVATFGQATLEGISDKLLLGGIFKPLGKSLFTRTISRVGSGGSQEGLTEIGQQMMERAQAGLPIDSEDAIAEYREAGIAGFLIGGGVRATGFGERRDTTPVIPEAEQTPEQEAQAALEAEADTILADDVAAQAPAEVEPAVTPTTELTPAQEAVVAKEGPQAEAIVKAAKAKVAEYSPEPTVKTAPATAAAQAQAEFRAEYELKTPNTITNELLDDIGVFSKAPLRSKIVGKKLSDPEVQTSLRKYAKNSIIRKRAPELEARINELLGDSDAAGLGTGVTTGDAGVGDGVTSGTERVAELGRRVRTSGGADTAATPDEGPVGGSVLPSELPAVADGADADTLADDYAGSAIWANADFDLPVTVLDEPAQSAPDGSLFKKVRSDDGTESFVPLAQLRAVNKPVQQPEEVAPEAVEELAKEVDAIVTEPVTPAMQQAAIPGQVTSAAQQIIPEAVPPAPRAAPVQGAPVPQADIQAAETARSDAVQAELNRRFEFKKNTGVREYHDTQVNERSLPDVTTATDKDGVLELISTADKDLDDRGKAAKLFFKRFRRPVDALDEMGAVAAVGPTQTVKKDYVQVQTKEGRVPQFSFYKGMTQEAAMNARKWVFDNMSRQAMAVTRDAAVLARRGTSKYNPSDAYISVVKAAKSIQQKEDNALKNQVNRYLASPEVNYKAPAELDQTMRIGATGQLVGERTTGPVTLSFKPIKGQTAFDSYMIGSMGFKKRKLPNKDEYVYFDPENDNKVLTPEEVQQYYDDLAYSQDQMGFLLIDPVHGLDMALLPSITNALQRGDLQFALNAIASTSSIDRIRQIAGKLAEVVGTTQVQVSPDLSQMMGRKAAGLFEPETNTVYIDANNGMNVHTVLHEMFHAATSASLANKALPTTKQLQRMLDSAREQLGEVYGTQNLDEFVAEAQSNPEFRSALALSKMDGVSIYSKFVDTMTKIMRRILGLPSSGNTAQLRELDRIVEGLLAPSPATRGAPSLMLEANTPKGGINIAKSAVAAVPPSKRDEYVEMASDVIYNAKETGQGVVSNVVLNSLDSRILTDVAKKKIPFAPELNVIIRKMSGAMRNRSDKLDAMVGNYAAWARKNKAAAKVMNNIIPKSTALRVDPSLPRNFYSSYKTTYHDLTTKKAVIKEFKSEKARLAWVQNFNANVDEKKTTKAKNMKDPDPQDLVAYDALRKQYDAMGKEGQAFYRQMRNFFQDTYDEIIPALRTRLEATIQDPNIRASAFEKLQDILMKESGLIRPYFPLMRKGKHRLQYTFIDENGQPDMSVEYYQNRRALDRAFKIAESKSAAGTKPHYTRADQPLKFDKVPSSSFVYDILKNMEASKASFRDKNGKPDNKAYEAAVQSVVDLALDAMPERSFMQGFRRRKDVRGYIGDTTPTKIGDTEFDAVSMMREKGRDLNRQIVQLQSAAEIERFRNKLRDGNYLSNPETADIARKLEQMAAFAQKPDVPRWSQVLNGVGFNMTMGLNFSSAAITFFDVAMSAMPIISAEYGVVNTGRAYREATSLLMNAPKTRGIMVTGPDGQPVEQEVKMGIQGKSMFNYLGVDRDQLPASEQAIRLDVLLKTASDQGQANQSLTQESLEIGRDAPLEGVNKWTSAMFHHSERFNRETTLRAAYGLEVQKLQAEGRQLTDQDYKDAAQKAIETTEFTLGSTAAAGRPIWAQSGVGNVLFLFKRFAIAKYYMMYKLGHDSIGTTNIERIMQEQGVTEAEAQQIVTDRKIARLGLRNFMISTGIMAGVGGMPMMGAISAIVNTFRDDDEDDFESQLRKFTGEGIYGGLANLIFDAEISSRISLNSLLYRPPFIEKDQSPIWTFAEQFGGPVVGLANSTIRGATELVDGLSSQDSLAIRRGAETIMPSALRNFSKAERYYTDGATTRRNDAVIEDISLYNALMQAAGFAPAEYVRELDYNRNIMRRKKAVSERRSKLNKRYNMAKMAGDRAEMRKIRAMQDEFNRELPAVFADQRITGTTRDRSYKAFAKNSGNARGGVIHTEAMKKIRDEYNQGFQGF